MKIIYLKSSPQNKSSENINFQAVYLYFEILCLMHTGRIRAD